MSPSYLGNLIVAAKLFKIKGSVDQAVGNKHICFGLMSPINYAKRQLVSFLKSVIDRQTSYTQSISHTPSNQLRVPTWGFPYFLLKYTSVRCFFN